MKTFPTQAVRNVALVGHGGAGKTTLAEALLLHAGAIPRAGRIEEGTTVLDFDPEEHRRGISVSLALASVELDGTKLNVLDAPGYADFLAEASMALAAADLAVFVVSAVDGVEVQTEVLWKMAAARGLPRAVFVSKLDRERASFRTVLQQLKDAFGAGIAPRQLPIGEEDELRGLVDLLDGQAYVYEDGKGKPGDVPAELEAEEKAVREALVEGIVVADESLMERYLGDEELSPRELTETLARGVAAGEVFPVLCGSAVKQVGIDRFAEFLVQVAPPPAATPDAEPALRVFKTLVDPYVGKINLFKVLQGTVKADAVLRNHRTGSDERLHQIFALRGKEQDPLTEVAAGDIAATSKLADTTTGDLLGAAVEVGPLDLPEPVLPTAIRAASKADEDKLANALHRVVEGDPALRVERNHETRQTVLWGMGETHTSIAIERIKAMGVDLVEEPVRVPYRETITGTAEAEGKYKKQTGGRGQFGVAFLRLEPLERGAGFEFVDNIVGGVIPRQFIPAVEKGVVETIESGGVLGFPVVDVKVTCYDGKHHPVDSSELAFKMAASLGFKDAEARAQPVLLEPISELVVTVPEAYQGDVIGDLNAKRGRIQGSEPVGGGEVEIRALVPTSEILRYAIDLRSLTGGRGRFRVAHSHYDPVPPHLSEKLIEEHRALTETRT